jgi:uncharacterized delta-60 repeat protein
MNSRRFTIGLVSIVAVSLVPVRAQSVNDGFNPQLGLSPVEVVALQPDGKILISRALSGANNAGLARLHADGSWDTNFSVPQIFNYLPARALVVQEDGRIVVGAALSALGSRTNLARLLPDGALDPTFLATDRLVKSLLLLPGGKILAGGDFGVVRLNGDGSVDGTFTNSASARVQAMLRQPDGKIVISGQIHRGIARLNSDGTRDPGFNPGAVLFPSGNDFKHCLALQSDGRIFATYYHNGSRRLFRFYPDGTHDSGFSGISNTLIQAVVPQPDGKILVGGSFTNLLGHPRTNLGRLNCDGSLDAAFTAGAISDRPPWELAISDLAVQPDGKIVVAGTFTNVAGYARNNIARLHPDGSADATLNLAPPIANFAVQTIAMQPDGRILVSGTQLGSVTSNSIARLNPDGSRDVAFNPVANSTVWNFAVQADGRILAGGFFTNMAGEARNRLARLNPDGTLDAAFNPGANDAVRGLVFQRDGRILVGGDFTLLGGQPRGRLGRLDADGNLDPFFNPQANDGIRALAVQADDKIIVGGFFTNIAGHARQRIARLTSDGSIDPDFNPGADNWVRCVVVLPDGNILVAGDFTIIGGQTRGRIARLYPNGGLDSTFDPGANERIWSVALDASGKVIVGGAFTRLAGQGCSHIARLNPDGTLDTTFGGGAGPAGLGSLLVWATTLQSDGKILVGGRFFSMDGQPREGIARLTSGSAAFQSLAIDDTGTTITWLRSGATPEIDLVTFERSTDGTNYTALGHGARIPGGWHLGDTSLPIGQKVYVRARGRSCGGTYSTSSGIIESVAQFYRVPRPYISSSSRLSSGAFQFSFDNEGHHPFAVLANTNLASPSWDILGFATNAGGPLYQFTDSATNSLPRRFYQLRGP